MLLTLLEIPARLVILYAMMRFGKYIFIRFILEKITINITLTFEVEWYDGSNRRIGQIRLHLKLTNNPDVAAVVPEDDVQTPAIQGHETPLIEQASEEAQGRKDHGCTTDSARPVVGEAQAI